MAFNEFADTLYCKTFDTDEIVRMGSFQVAESLELQYIRLLIYINGTIAGTERIRLRVYSDSGFSNVLYTSDYSSMSSITGLSTRFLGWVRFSFDREHINKNITYYLTAEIDNYTFAEPFYIGAMYDFPHPIYDNSENLFYDHPIAFQLFGYK
jgi:hypothetical protein